MSEIFETASSFKWEIDGKTFNLPVNDHAVTGGNRIVQFERRDRDGAKLDDTGCSAKQFVLKCQYHNGSSERDIPLEIYPNELNELLLSFETHEVGKLSIPLSGIYSVRAQKFERHETSDRRDMADVTLTFVEDNEETALTEIVFVENIQTLAQKFTKTTEKVALTPKLVAETIIKAVETVDNLISQPFEEFDKAQAQVDRVRNALKRTVDPNRFNGTPAEEMFKEPSNSRKTTRDGNKLSDSMDRTLNKRIEEVRKVRTMVFDQEKSLMDLAPAWGMSVEDLFKLNSHIPNKLIVPPNTPIRRFA